MPSPGPQIFPIQKNDFFPLFFFFEWPEDTEEGKPLLPHYCVPSTELNSWYDPGIQAGRYPESRLPKNVTEKQGDVGVTPTKTPLPLEKKTPSLYQQSGRQNSEKAEKTANYKSQYFFMRFQWLRHTLQGVGSWW